MSLASNGDAPASFDALKKLGAIIPCPVGEQADRLADEYLTISARGHSLVVVAQTWDEVHRVNDKVREKLKANGLIGADDVQVEALEPVDLTDAQKRDTKSFDSRMIITFNQRYRGVEPGTRGKLLVADDTGLILEVEKRIVLVPKTQLGKISFYLPKTIPIASGDRLHLKANRKLTGSSRAMNGEIVTVGAVEADGTIRLRDGRKLDPTYREFLRGYAVTSYASQGKTVDHVLFSDSAVRAATNAQQWYVTTSRGRRGIRIFTPNPAELRNSLANSGSRPLALDVTTAPKPQPLRPRINQIDRYLQRFGDRAVRLYRTIRNFNRFNPEPRYRHERKIK